MCCVLLMSCNLLLFHVDLRSLELLESVLDDESSNVKPQPGEAFHELDHTVNRELNKDQSVQGPASLVLEPEIGVSLTEEEEVIGADQDYNLIECLQAIEGCVLERPHSYHVGDRGKLDKDERVDLEEVVLDLHYDGRQEQPSQEEVRVVQLSPLALRPLQLEEGLKLGILPGELDLRDPSLVLPEDHSGHGEDYHDIEREECQ